MCHPNKRAAQLSHDPSVQDTSLLPREVRSPWVGCAEPRFPQPQDAARRPAPLGRPASRLAGEISAAGLVGAATWAPGQPLCIRQPFRPALASQMEKGPEAEPTYGVSHQPCLPPRSPGPPTRSKAPPQGSMGSSSYCLGLQDRTERQQPRQAATWEVQQQVTGQRQPPRAGGWATW